MKVSTVLAGLVILLLLWVLPPFLFLKLNQALNLPVIGFSWLKFAGLLIIIAALCMDVYLFMLFKVYGKGTPVPIEPTRELIARGIYRKTRNPMYLGHMTIRISKNAWERNTSNI